jgi:hypothetical protein
MAQDDLFMPVPLASVDAAGQRTIAAAVNAPAASGSPLAVLSFIGAGMAIGGLVSVRLSHRWD